MKLMSLFKNIKSFYPEDGVQTEKYILQAYQSENPAFISLKTDPLLSKSIT